MFTAIQICKQEIIPIELIRKRQYSISLDLENSKFLVRTMCLQTKVQVSNASKVFSVRLTDDKTIPRQTFPSNEVE